MFRNLLRCRVSDATVRSVDAPASIPLPQPAVPEVEELEADAVERCTALTSSGAADEFCGHTLDEHYDRWHAETVTALAGLADEQARVDRALVDEMHHRTARAAGRAEVAAERARQLTAQADRLWENYFPVPAEPRREDSTVARPKS